MEVQNFLLKVGQGDKKLQLVFLVNSYEAVVEALSVSFFFLLLLLFLIRVDVCVDPPSPTQRTRNRLRLTPSVITGPGS